MKQTFSFHTPKYLYTAQMDQQETFASPVEIQESNFYLNKQVCGIIGFDQELFCNIWTPKIRNITKTNKPNLNQYNFSSPTIVRGISQVLNPNLSDQAYYELVKNCAARLKESGLQKLVTARKFIFDIITEHIESSENQDGDPYIEHINRSLIEQNPQSAVYCLHIKDGYTVLGATPELVIKKQDDVIYAFPLAGTAPRFTDKNQDQEAGIGLLKSEKNLEEHRILVKYYREILTPFCVELNNSKTPELLRTPTTWHLGTFFKGRLKSKQISSLKIAMALHPTPAISGYPVEVAIEEIRKLEGDRGFYGGLVGWQDSQSNGEWHLAIRGAEVRKLNENGKLHNYQITALAGGGILTNSDPTEEVKETLAKLKVIKNALTA